MLKFITTSALVAALAVAPQAFAQTLRWASQGDPQTMDPHSQNESMTNMMNGQVYEKLVNRDKQLGIVPALATEWQQVSPTLWRFKLRPNVKFHDGTPFTADDVVFSMERGAAPTSTINQYATAVGKPRKVDDLTVEFQLAAPNPIFLQHLETLWIMSKVWSEKNKVTRPLDFKNKEESYAGLNANGTGPYMLVSRAPGIKTVYKRNPNWWGKFEGNVQEIVYTPIGNDATRLAALVSGEIDFVLDPAPRDVARLRNTAGVKIIDGPENRIVFIGMDQFRDKLLYGSVPGDKNPFKDERVRRAMYQAVDIETLKTKLMNGQSYPTGGLTPSPLGSYNDPEIEKRLPYDLAAARKLMADAGYADGFEVTLDCPNNRYVNDEEICQNVVAMWARIGVKTKLVAESMATFIQKVQNFDTSLYLLGWGVATYDAQYSLQSLIRTRTTGADGNFNFSKASDPTVDKLVDAMKTEVDVTKRNAMIREALIRTRDEMLIIPLHHQVRPWAMKPGVTTVHRSDDRPEARFTTVK